MRVVVITGVASRVGRATARRFAGHGWTVIGVDIKACDPLGGVELETADMANDAEVRTFMRRIADTHGHIDAIVNNASVRVTRPLLETSVDEWDITMAVNVKAAFLTCKHGVPLFPRSDGGSIVNVGSVHAEGTAPNHCAFATSKGALVAMTRALAVELQPANVRVNAVLAGATRARAGREDARVGQPEDIASAIYFLADEAQSAFVTGASFVVDGGARARLLE